MATLGILLIAVIALFITWYSLSLRHKRKKAKEILRWIQSSLSGRGHVVGISWTSPSRFRVPLRLTCGVFQRAWVLVEPHEQQTPIQCLFSTSRPPFILLQSHWMGVCCACSSTSTEAR